MSTPVILLNMAGAAFACLANVWSGVFGWAEWRWVRYTVAFFAAIYVVAYGVLLTGIFAIADWSYVMRGVSVPVWFFVWAWPAVHSSHILRKVRDQIHAE